MSNLLHMDDFGFLKMDFIILFQDNYSPLHLGVEAGKSAGVECLLGHGAKVHIKGKSLKLVFM